MEKLDGQKGKHDFSQLLKLALEVGPLAIFFVANGRLGIFYATAAFMVATVISLVTSRILFKRIPILALVTGVFVMFFGFLTIYLQDDTFIKIKPTIVNVLFAVILSAGLYFRRPVLKFALGEVMKLREEGWRILTLRWIGFFVTSGNFERNRLAKLRNLYLGCVQIFRNHAVVLCVHDGSIAGADEVSD